MKTIVVAFINLYQTTLSPDHGWRRHQHPYGFCRFYPTCSEYTKQAIIQHGLGRGSWLGIKRLARCHPWSVGGVDPIPSR